MNLLRTILDNGLKVMIREAHTAPVASFWLWYRVGSRNEHLGITGISHWVEHMLYKGTERWPRGSVDQAVAREGGVFNGFTWYDFTTYCESLPVERVSLAMDIESDRMSKALFTPEDVASERTVIISERQGAENSPLFLLEEEVSATAYHIHPYRHETIGYMCDLETMTRDDLYQHYRTYYTPNNAVLALAGDFNAGEMERIIERYFDRNERGSDIPVINAIEPPQRGERRVILEGAGQTDYLQVVYHAPEAKHEDFFAITLLNAILSGGSAFPVGGGLSNHTSRLYRALVDAELTVDIYGSLIPTLDPGLYRITATVWPGRKAEEAESALQTEIERLQNELVTEKELEKARRQARALFAYSSESITNQAFWLGFSEIFADYEWFMRYLDNLDMVTAADVQRAAQTYLGVNNRTVGWYLAKAAADDL
ncbi:MAG: insulinase family protein [Anaerolineae bacterium]|nr:insulinase family protein [Anaerolineae bacterium]